MGNTISNRRDFIRRVAAATTGGAVCSATVAGPVDAWTRESARNAISEEYARINSTRKEVDDKTNNKEAVQKRMKELDQAEGAARYSWGLGSAIIAGLGGACLGNALAGDNEVADNTVSDALKSQPVEDYRVKKHLSRRAFLKNTASMAGEAATLTALYGTGAAVGLGTLTAPARWVFGVNRRSENELEAIDPEGKLSIEERKNYQSKENWKDWRARIGFYGPPIAGITYLATLGKNITQQEHLAYMFEQASLSNGGLKIIEIDDNANLRLRYQQDWFESLPQKSNLREILVKKYGLKEDKTEKAKQKTNSSRAQSNYNQQGTQYDFDRTFDNPEDLFNNLDDLLKDLLEKHASISQANKATKKIKLTNNEKQSISSFLNDLKRRKAYQQNEEAKNLIDQLDSQISEKLETMSWKDLTLTALNLIEDSNLTRKVLLAIFHTDRLTPELKEDQTVMKFATPLFKYVSQR